MKKAHRDTDTAPCRARTNRRCRGSLPLRPQRRDEPMDVVVLSSSHRSIVRRRSPRPTSSASDPSLCALSSIARSPEAGRGNTGAGGGRRDGRRFGERTVMLRWRRRTRGGASSSSRGHQVGDQRSLTEVAVSGMVALTAVGEAPPGASSDSGVPRDSRQVLLLEHRLPRFPAARDGWGELEDRGAGGRRGWGAEPIHLAAWRRSTAWLALPPA